MSFVNVHEGSGIAKEIPGSSIESPQSRIEVRSLADLLVQLNSQPTSQLPMLRTTAGKIAAFLHKPIDEISLDLIHAKREEFRPFLESLKFKEGSVRSYVNYLRILMEAGEDCGWRPFVRLPAAWQPALDLAKKNCCLRVIKSLAQSKTTPAEVAQEDFERWTELRIGEGIRFASVQLEVSGAWRTLVSCGFTKNAPLAILRKKNYGVRLSDFPSRLKDDVTELLRWKCTDFEPDRPKGAKIRQISATNLRGTISSLYGYATNIAGIREIGSLEQLIQKSIVSRFATWRINEQKAKGTPLISQLASVLAAVSQHPAYREMDLSWFRPLLNTIPTESYDEVKARKAKKYLHYDVLACIPAKVHAKRGAEAKRGPENVARLVMEELMIAWMLVFPWRQLNIRQCKVSGPEPNLFKARVPDFSSIDMPEWAARAQVENPNAQFWQVKFSTQETKTGVSIHSLVPRQLIGLLEEYLSEHRPSLLKGRHCDTLFVSPGANSTKTSFINDTVSDLTLRFGGRRVTPHLFRDIVAYAWLKAHPKDFLTLSKMLWHKNVQTTIDYYGTRFNDSTAVVAMEEWLEQRAANAGSK